MMSDIWALGDRCVARGPDGYGALLSPSGQIRGGGRAARCGAARHVDPEYL